MAKLLAVNKLLEYVLWENTILVFLLQNIMFNSVFYLPIQMICLQLLTKKMISTRFSPSVLTNKLYPLF